MKHCADSVAFVDLVRGKQMPLTKDYAVSVVPGGKRICMLEFNMGVFIGITNPLPALIVFFGNVVNEMKSSELLV